jgi:wyosine [tRNA(Phe)-imidazoG37] synthetase (radical SAM superfamily)
MEYVPFNKVRDELIHFFNNNPDLDYVTFSGSGEPTLNIRIGDVLRFIKQLKPGLPVAVLTNGTLLSDKNVRKEIQDADIVLPSLDAATKGVFDSINRPASGLDIEKHIEGLVDFRNEYKGKIYLEIFILPGYNYEENELKKLRKAVLRIKPDAIQLNTLDRPGTVSDLSAATRQQMEKIIEEWDLPGMEIIAAAPKRKEIQSYRNDAEEAIMGMIARRPCTIDDLSKTLGIHISEINKYLDVLESEKKIRSVRQNRGVFYKPA